MHNLLKLGSLAVIVAATAVPVLADNSSSSSSQASSSMASSSAEQTGANVNYGNIISAIQAGKSADLTTITDSSTINIVLVSDVKANGDTNALDNALKKNADAAATLKANVDTNAALKAKLTAGGYTSDQVVAVIAEADGSFTVVVNDQHP